MCMKKPSLKNILSSGVDLDHRFIADYNDLSEMVTILKGQGYRIVLTQGVWDLIHEGHANYLELAKKEGDILIVGVDSDALTRQRKGPSRPVVPEQERVRMVAHLRHVDIITLRDVGEDIGDLIRTVQPDVLVVSESTKDFTDKMKQEYQGIAGKIVNLQPQSTSTTTGRIRNLTIEGAEKLAEKINDLTTDFIKQIRNG